MEKRSVRSLPVQGRRVLVRVDFNVPLTESGQIADDRRIAEALPTLHHLQAAQARTILMSHLGRPDGRRDPHLSLRPVARRLSQLLGQPIPLAEDCIGIAALNAVAKVTNGGFLLLENLRFHPGEEANDPGFAAQLSQLGELFVEEAFGTVHRAHASTVGVPKRLPACAGFLVEREVRELSRLRDHYEKPYVALLGGAKVSDKLPLITSFVGRADTIAIGGALAFPFLKSAGHALGGQPVEEGVADSIPELLAKARDRETEVLLPDDVVVLRPGSDEPEVVSVARVPEGARIFDIGPRTRERFVSTLARSRTVFWNGPLGKAEDPRFALGTREVLASLIPRPGYHVSAGGDSARMVQDLGVGAAFQYISTGGGAALEFVEGVDLPGLAVLPNA
jgi:phosphoglycerate kinase